MLDTKYNNHKFIAVNNKHKTGNTYVYSTRLMFMLEIKFS